MATIKVFDLPLADSENSKHHLAEEFIEAVSNSVIRALDARQLQDIRGGFQSDTTVGMIDDDFGMIGTGYGSEELAS